MNADNPVRRSLAERTAHLFTPGAGSAETAHGSPAGNNLGSMADMGAPSQPTIRRLDSFGAPEPTVNQSTGESAPTHSTDDGELFDRIVDALEDRVIAELERRGRRHSPGVF